MDGKIKRSVILCNSLSLLIALMPFLFAALVIIIRGSGSITIPLITQPFLLLLPILFNSLRLTTLSRVVLSIITPIVIMSYSIYNKSIGLDIQTSSYVGLRITMIASSILPFLLFTDKEKTIMFLCASVSILLILGFDPIHSLFEVGYTDLGLNDTSYLLTNVRAIIGIIVIGSCALILKRLFEKSERKNEDLIKDLANKNEEITSQLQEISSQSENILSQKIVIEEQYTNILQREAKLIESRNELILAKKIIENQQELLHIENIGLEQKLIEQNIMLKKTNNDLIKMNASLQQFSYMASHNLRGPVASLLGIFNIVPINKLDGELFDLLLKSKQSVEKLDEVITDLVQIRDINTNLTDTKEEVYWQEIIDYTLEQHQDKIKEYNVLIKPNISEAPYIIGIRSILNNILYNLINNAIKFRSPDRQLIIHIKTQLVEDRVLLEVKDNGLGIDMSLASDKIFMMYKRFHDHVEGKGLGLYFTKVETELIGGSISVSSELNHHTIFSLEFPSGMPLEYGQIPNS